MIGYNTRKRTLVNPQGNISINMMLPALGYELDQVTITESRRQTNTVQQIDMKANKWMPDASGGNIESIIATQAGVSSNNELSSQYNVRGGSFDENMVYVNGIEVYRPLLVRSGQQEGLSFINPDMVENVGFSSGGYEAKYGDKMSSVLDITYKKPEHFEATGAFSLLGVSAYIGFGTKKFSWINSVRYKSNRYLLGTRILMVASGEPSVVTTFTPARRPVIALAADVTGISFSVFAPTEATEPVRSPRLLVP